MKKLFLFFFSLLQIVSSQAQDVPILVDSQWLHQHQSDANVVILQVTFLKFDYDGEHIAGARYLWPAWLAPDSPVGAMNDPDPAKAKEVIESLGISNNSHVILCYVRNEVSGTARMFLALENSGMKGRVSFLDGGLEAWKKSGYAVTKEVPTFKKGKFKVDRKNFIVDKEYVLKHLRSDSVDIVDARMKRYYDGEPVGNPRDGHITGAKNIPYTDMVDATTGVFKPKDQLQAYFTAVSETKKTMVLYCFIGQTACVTYIAGRMLGYPMKLYDGSLQEWSRIKELPMEVTEKK